MGVRASTYGIGETSAQSAANSVIEQFLMVQVECRGTHRVCHGREMCPQGVSHQLGALPATGVWIGNSDR